MSTEADGVADRFLALRGAKYQRRPVRNANEIVADRIRQLVLDGVLRPGDRVPQDEIAASLGMSRLPVREALISLKHQGVVTLSPRRGAYVSRFDEEVVRDHFNVFAYLLAYATSLATSRGDDDLVEAVGELAAAISAEHDADEFEYLAAQFMRTVTLGSGSAHVRLVLRSINPLMPGNFYAVIPASADGLRIAAPKVAAAMRNHDGDLAAATYAGYVRGNADLLVAHLRERGVFGQDGRPTP